MRTTARDAYSLGCAGLAEGTNANTFKTSNNLSYQVAGRAYQKAATDNIAFAAETALTAAFAAQAAKTVCVYFFFVDAAGTITVSQSTAYPNSQSQSYLGRAINWPEVSGKACFAALKIDCINATTFTAGSSDITASGVTATYYNAGDDYGTPITI